MTASSIQITAGSGTRLATNSYTEGGNTVHDEKFIPGEYPYPTYSVVINNISIATANDHVITINAGSSLNVRIRRIRLVQGVNATTAAVATFELMRTTTGAPSGGTAVTPAKFNTGDAASGATAMTLPSTKGTESTLIWRETFNAQQTSGVSPTGDKRIFEWIQQPNEGPLVILAGTTNGFAVKNINAIAAATVNGYIEFIETSW